MDVTIEKEDRMDTHHPRAVKAIKFSLLLVVFTLTGLLAFSSPAWAVDAVITCYKCVDGTCNCPSGCAPCSSGGNEGDRFWFDGTASTGDIISYSWTMGDGEEYSYGQFDHNYNTPSNPAVFPNGYPVSLTVQDNWGSPPDTETINIPIANVPPTGHFKVRCSDNEWYDAANVAVSPCYIYVGAYPQFDATGSYDKVGAITKVEWDFDYQQGNFVPEMINFIHSNKTWGSSDLGEHEVAIRATDDDTPAATTIYHFTLTVVPDGPLAKITPPALPFYEGDTVHFSGAMSIPSNYPIRDYLWDFDFDGIFGDDISGEPDYTTMEVDYAFNDDRFYTVALKVIDEFDREHTNYYSVKPDNKLPEASFTVLPGLTVNEGEEVELNASGSSAVPGEITAYYWDFTYDGYTFDLNPNVSGMTTTHVFQEDSLHDSYYFEGQPQEWVKVGLRVQDDDHAGGNPSIDYAYMEITVLDIPPEAVIRTIDGDNVNTALGQGEEGQFDPTPSHSGADDIVKYEWDFHYSGVPGEFNAEVTDTEGEAQFYSWDILTTYKVALKITDDDGLTALSSIDVVIEDRPIGPKISGPFGFQCDLAHSPCELELSEGETVEFSAENSYVPAGDIVTMYQWDIDYSGVADEFNPYVPYLTTGDCEGSTHCYNNPQIACTTDTDCPDGKLVITFPISPIDGPATKSMGLRVYDNDRGVSEIVSVNITVANIAPVFDPEAPPNTDAYENVNYTFSPTIIDPGDTPDQYTYTCLEKPEAMSCNEVSGYLFWAPTINDVACGIDIDIEHHVVMEVRDGDGGVGTLDYWIRVLNTNQPPYISSFTGGNNIAIVGEKYQPLVVGDDDDKKCGDQLTYYLIDAPDGMTISQTEGFITWYPAQDQLGRHEYEACVKDDDEEYACIEVTVNVQSSDQTPLVNCGEFLSYSTLPGRVCMEGQTVANPMGNQLSFAWDYVGGPEEIWLEVMEEDPPTACFAANVNGVYEINLTAHDEILDVYSPHALCAITIENVAPGAVTQFKRTYTTGSWVTLDGTLSGDYNENEVTYSWTDDYDVLDYTDIASPGFLADTVGYYSFPLEVNDSELTSEASVQEVEIMELDAQSDIAHSVPFAHLQEPEVSLIDNQVILNGGASTSRNGEAVVYTWDFLQTEGEPGEPDFGFANESDRSRLFFTPSQAGRYVFAMQVTSLGVPSNWAQRTVYVETNTDQIPIAEAGNNQIETITIYTQAPYTAYATVILDGSASVDPDGEDLTYSWRQIYGHPVILDDDTDSSPQFLSFEPGLFRFELIVNDGELTSKPDKVWVVVSEPTDSVPTATLDDISDPGNIVVSPNLPVTLDASVSFDPEDSALTYHWSQIEGPSVPLFTNYDGGSPSVSYTDPVVTFLPDIRDMNYRFLLWVDDGSQPSIPVEITVYVLDQENSPPLAIVTEDSINAEKVGDVIQMDGSPSQDPDSDEITYLWEQIQDGSDFAVAVVDSDKAQASFTPVQGGTYVFKLTVFDPWQPCVTPAQVTVNVPDNQFPVADAGEDIQSEPGRIIQLDGTGSSDPDGHEIAEYKWEIDETAPNTLGVTADLLEPDDSSPSPTFQAFDVGEVTFILTVDDGFPGGKSLPDTVKVIAGNPVVEDGDEEIDTVEEDTEKTETVAPPKDGGGGCNSSQSSLPVWFAIMLGLAIFFRQRKSERA